MGIGRQARLLREIEAEDQVGAGGDGQSIGSPAASSPGGMVSFSAPSKVSVARPCSVAAAAAAMVKGVRP
jgi:hypothetical protein